jgi:hypothetical protein
MSMKWDDLSCTNSSGEQGEVTRLRTRRSGMRWLAHYEG